MVDEFGGGFCTFKDVDILRTSNEKMDYYSFRMMKGSARKYPNTKVSRV